MTYYYYNHYYIPTINYIYNYNKVSGFSGFTFIILFLRHHVIIKFHVLSNHLSNREMIRALIFAFTTLITILPALERLTIFMVRGEEFLLGP